MENSKYRLVTEPCYNPFLFEQDGICGYEVSKIHFFKVENGNGEVIASARWFGHLPNGNTKYVDFCSNNDFKTVDLPYDEIPLRRKLSFDKDKAFYLKEKGENKIELYLNISELKDFNITAKTPDILYHGTECRTCDVVTFKVTGEVKYRQNEEKQSEAVVGFTCNHKTEPTEFGKKCKEFSEILSEGIRKVDISQIAELIQDGSIDKFIAAYNEWKSATAD
jgi:hypothetical protein